MTEQLLPFLTASVLLTLSPGPDIIYVLVQGMANGKKYGIITALGLVTGILVHTSLVAFGASLVIQESEMLFRVIKVLGAAYLFYLAVKVYHSEPGFDFSPGKARKNRLASLYLQGFLMNVLNPKVAIFFLAFFPGFIWDSQGNTLLQFYVLGFIFMSQAFFIFALVAIMAGRISKYLRMHSMAGVVFKWLQVLVFIGIGIFILF